LSVVVLGADETGADKVSDGDEPLPSLDYSRDSGMRLPVSA